MKIFAPDYYKDFRCLMGECKHTCCAGWEIDIDEETAEYYKSVPGDFGKKLCQNIDFGEDCASFILAEHDRCPFLNKDGLCEIILNLGERAISQVCDDHPRFRNFYEGRTEIGLGLCCEAVAKMVIEKKTETVITEIEDDGEDYEILPEEEEFFALREKVFSIAQERETDLEKRIEKILGLCSAELPEKDFAEWAEIYLGLERLDEKWTEVLKKIRENPALPKDFDEISAEQLLCYFLFRHLSPWNLPETCAFAVLSLLMTEKAAEQVGIYEGARLYSSEIEYSDENIDALLEIIGAERT